MTKIISPLNSGMASGRYQNLVFAYNQYGPYSRDYVPATDPNTGQQQAWRTAMAALSDEWGGSAGMTQTQRNTWIEFGKTFTMKDRFGRQRYASGREWFIKYNIWRKVYGLGAHYTAPADTINEYRPEVEISQDTNGDIIATYSLAPTGDQRLYFNRVLNQSLGRMFRPNQTTFAQNVTPASPNPVVIAVNSILDSEEKRHFFTWRAIDGAGRQNPKVETYIDAARSKNLELVADSYNGLVSNTPTTVFNAGTSSSIQMTGAVTNRTIIHFDLSSAPTGTYTSADLSLYFTSASSAGTQPLTIHKMLVSNVNTETTWNQRSSGVNWSAAGMQSGVDFDATIIDTIDPSPDSTEVVDLLTTFQFWIDNPSNPTAICLIPTLTNANFKQVATQLYATPANRPTIETS